VHLKEVINLKPVEFQKWVLALVAALVVALVSLAGLLLSRASAQPVPTLPTLRIELLPNSGSGKVNLEYEPKEKESHTPPGK
jgi:hypothetical protein